MCHQRCRAVGGDISDDHRERVGASNQRDEPQEEKDIGRHGDVERVHQVEIGYGDEEEKPAAFEVVFLIARVCKLDEEVEQEGHAHPELECHVLVVAQERYVHERVV